MNEEINFCETCRNYLGGRCMYSGALLPWYTSACTNHYEHWEKEAEDDEDEA